MKKPSKKELKMIKKMTKNFRKEREEDNNIMHGVPCDIGERIESMTLEMSASKVLIVGPENTIEDLQDAINKKIADDNLIVTSTSISVLEGKFVGTVVYSD